MILAVRQPALFPWPGLLHRLSVADVMLVMDDVQFSKQSYDNRAAVLDAGGRATWLTIPVRHEDQRRRIADVRVADDDRWRLRHVRRLRAAYHHAPNRDATLALLGRVYASRTPSLVAYQLASTAALVHAFGVRTGDCRLASTLTLPDGRRDTRWIVELCRAWGATTYLSGLGIRQAQDGTAFRRAGIRLLYQHPTTTTYPQLGARFVPGLSSIDLAMSVEWTDVPGLLSRLFTCVPA